MSLEVLHVELVTRLVTLAVVLEVTNVSHAQEATTTILGSVLQLVL
jgi:hypothetical protein